MTNDFHLQAGTYTIKMGSLCVESFVKYKWMAKKVIFHVCKPLVHNWYLLHMAIRTQGVKNANHTSKHNQSKQKIGHTFFNGGKHWTSSTNYDNNLSSCSYLSRVEQVCWVLFFSIPTWNLLTTRMGFCRQILRFRIVIEI